jgi:hypothetical protein
MPTSYDIGDVIVALRVLSIFIPDGVAVRFNELDIEFMDLRAPRMRTIKLPIHEAAEKIFEGL